MPKKDKKKKGKKGNGKGKGKDLRGASRFQRMLAESKGETNYPPPKQKSGQQPQQGR